jgi:CAAD domains of cyanobacterial aminoacyl-tRNA synthetase
LANFTIASPLNKELIAMSIDLTTELTRIEEYDETHPDYPKNKPAASQAEYDNAYVETATVENMEPIEPIETIVAEEVVADAPDREDEAMKYDERSPVQSPGEAAASLHSGGDAAESADGSVAMLDSEDDGMKYDERSSVQAPSEAAASLHSAEAIVAAETPVGKASPMENPAPQMSIPDIASTDSPVDGESLIDSAQDTWQSLQTGKSAEYFDRAKAYVIDFFNTNRQLIVALGVAFLAIISIKLLFAGLNAIDDIPLVAPLLKVIGLFYTVRFVLRYLIREQDRQELLQAIDRTKTEIFGS